MTDEKTEPVCHWCQEPAERHLGRLKMCTNGGALSFTPTESEANATIVDLRAKIAYWKEHSGAHQERAEGWKNAEEIAIRERDAAIERAEAAEQAGAYLIKQQGAHSPLSRSTLPSRNGLDWKG